MQEVRDQAAESGGGWWSRCALLVGLCLVVYVPGFFTIPPVDRDESRFAQASRQMFESVALPSNERDPARHGGGLLVPMVQDRPRLNKPPLIYWLQAASAALCSGGDPMRDAIWMYRVPSLLAGVAAVLLTWRIGAGMFGASVGRRGAVMLAVCPMVAWEAHQGRADMVLLAWTVGAMGALWDVWARPDRGWGGAGADRLSSRFGLGPVSFWACIAGGIMAKGPITPIVAGLAALTLSVATRRWGWLLRLRPALGAVIVTLAVGPWVAGVAHRVGWSEYLSSVYNETIGRSVSAREGHWGPPGYHALLTVVLFWPGSLMAGSGVMRAWKEVLQNRDREGSLGAEQGQAPARPRLRSGDPLLFCLAWMVPSWVLFELMGTKLPHYVMPLYPALALISARALPASGRVPGGMRAGVLLWAIAGLALSAAPAVLAQDSIGAGGGSRLVANVALVALSIVVLGSAMTAWHGRFREPMRFAVAHMAVLAVVLFGVVLPRCRAIWVTRDVGEFIQPALADPSRPIAATGFGEDSLVFWTRGRVQRIAEADADGWLAAHPRGVLIRELQAEEGAREARIFDGLDYSTGKRVRLGVWMPLEGVAP